MKAVHLIPEIRLLVIFDERSKECFTMQLTPFSTKALCDEFKDAVRHLVRPDAM